MKQQEILKHINYHHSTGTINDALIPFFDQDGRWRGDQILSKSSILPSKFSSIRKAFLPFSRRTRASRHGTVLRTSFYWRGDETLKISYSRIDGSMLIPNNAFIHANELGSIGGHFVTNSSHRIQLPNLTVVGGDFEATQCLGLDAPQLCSIAGNVAISANIPESLKTVGGNLRVFWSLSLVAPRLQYVGKSFNTHHCTTLVLPALDEVGALITQTEGKVDAPKLHTVRGDFLAASSRIIRAPSLRSVIGNIDSSSAKDFYNPALTVRGQWQLYPGAIEHRIQRMAACMAMRGNTWPMYL